jgi:GxxExxY protein
VELGDRDEPEADIAFFVRDRFLNKFSHGGHGVQGEFGRFRIHQTLSPVKHSELTSAIIAACINVHKTLGPGLLESVYEKAVCLELAALGLRFSRQQGIRVFYNGINLDMGFRADIIVEDQVVVELKSIEHVMPIHKKVVLTYLRFTKIEVGLLVNFNVEKLTDGLTRLMLDKN